jgi:hypothetical protein
MGAQTNVEGDVHRAVPSLTPPCGADFVTAPGVLAASGLANVTDDAAAQIVDDVAAQMADDVASQAVDDAVGQLVDDTSGALRPGEVGRFGDLRKMGLPGDDLTPHHMPQRALGFTSADDGGALVMTQAEHAQTRTYFWRGAQSAAQDAGRPFRDVLAADIWDVRSIVGSRYNKGLLALIDYYRTNFPDLIAE